MTEIMTFNNSVIMTIPGIGYINGGIILGDIGISAVSPAPPSYLLLPA